MNQIPGDEWMESNVTRRDVVRYIKMKDKLLAMMPWYTTPVECYIIDSAGEHDYIKVACGLIGHQWIKRSQLNVVALLPQPVLNPKKGPLQQTPDCPPWMDQLPSGGGGE
jgi:hypothetical protein